MAIHNREFDDERCKNCSVNAKCLACDIYVESDKLRRLKMEELEKRELSKMKGEQK